MALISALVDGEHGLAGVRDVVRARDRLGKRGELDEISRRKLIDLHRPAHVAAQQDALQPILAQTNVSKERPPTAQHGTHRIERRLLLHDTILTASSPDHPRASSGTRSAGVLPASTSTTAAIPRARSSTSAEFE